jgi:hypothetical protein
LSYRIPCPCAYAQTINVAVVIEMKRCIFVAVMGFPLIVRVY